MRLTDFVCGIGTGFECRQ